MNNHLPTKQNMHDYIQELYQRERAPATISKYQHDITCFYAWHRLQGGGSVTKETMIHYKAALVQQYEPMSVNSMLAAVNGFLAFMGWYECRVKNLKIQPAAYMDVDRELTREEYARLVRAARAKNDERLANILQTICGTGIRVSELQFITVEAVARGFAIVNNKGKTRKVLLPHKLCGLLKAYGRRVGIRAGSIFVTNKGKPLNRCNIWAMMKKLCAMAGVAARKVYPHALRHLFARCFYKQERDLDHLAAILGHSNINTTRIYTKTDGEEHRSQIERLRLVI